MMNTHFTRQSLDYGAVAQLRDLVPIVLLSIALGAVIVAFRRLIDLPSQVELLCLLGVGGLTYLLFALPLAHHLFPDHPLRAQIARLFGTRNRVPDVLKVD